MVQSESSTPAISSAPARGKGAADLRENVSCWLSGRSSWSARWMAEPLDSPMLLLRSVTEGRGGATVTGSVRVRPSFRVKRAVSLSPTRSFGAWLLGGRVRRRLVLKSKGAGVGEAVSWFDGVLGGAGVKVRSLMVS